MFRKYSEEEYQLAIRELGAELADAERRSYEGEIESSGEEMYVHTPGNPGDNPKTWDSDSQKIIRFIHACSRELVPRELGKFKSVMEHFVKTGDEHSRKVFLSNLKGLEIAFKSAVAEDFKSDSSAQQMLSDIQSRLEEISVGNWDIEVKRESDKLAKEIEAYFILVGLAKPKPSEDYDKYYYKYPYKRKEKLSEEDVLQKIRESPPARTEQDVIGHGTVDVLLEDAGVEIIERHETPREMEDRKITGALKELKKLREKEKLSKVGWYPSKGYSPSELEAIKGYEKHKAELRAQELSGKKKKTKSELEQESLARAVDSLLSENY